MPGLITLLSDFGSAGPYPAAMKAVLAGFGGFRLIDISHDVPRHDVRAGAYLLASVAPFTPAGTVHLAVVDPGVGTARRAVIVAVGGQLFVGPDNGLLLPAARRLGVPRAYVITDAPLLRRARSATFHGRDLFAPAAGLLARGTPPAALGAPASDLVDLALGVGRTVRDALIGEVVYTDPFGNLVTNIAAALLPAAGTRVTVRVGRRTVPAAISETYGTAPRGGVAVVPGSDGLAEIAAREASAAERFSAVPGTSVRIALRRRRDRVD